MGSLLCIGKGRFKKEVKCKVVEVMFNIISKINLFMEFLNKKMVFVFVGFILLVFILFLFVGNL